MKPPHLNHSHRASGKDGLMDTDARLVPLDGSFNFRDLGGYPAPDGRTTRWGRLYRADALHELTGDDVIRLRELGLRTVVDLRTERELVSSGRGPLGLEEVDFHHLAVVKEGVRADGTSDRAAEGESVAAPAPAGDDLAERYLWYLDVGRVSLVTALMLLGGDQHYPLVFHCAAGKDRTGVLAALVLEILGVERRVIVADYVITADRLRFILQRWRTPTRVSPSGWPRCRPPGSASRRRRWRDSSTSCSPDSAGPGRGRWRPACPPRPLDRIADLMLEPGA